ncbi:MAG: dUTP diphosphatase [Ruminococcaceae bacterium]|nr:dUTP diphosphatase [Oscillospiraceae bacterium]
MRVEVKIKKLSEKAIMPTKGSVDAAGADLYALCEENIVIEPGETVMIGTGLAMELPGDTVGLIYARSGIASKRGLAPANKVGVVDNDYRGEIKVALHNHSTKTQVIENGERIAQLVVMPYYSAIFTEIDELSETCRGDGGFGSTGTK